MGSSAGRSRRSFPAGTYIFILFSFLISAVNAVGFYSPKSLFLSLAQKYGTDKVSMHNYDVMYTKYLSRVRREVKKILEIGLGCNMAYGPGASARLWRDYLPRATIFEAEYDAQCVKAWSREISELNVTTLVGDQSDTATLKKWIRDSGGEFDVIIDDGGHTNMQMYNSFIVLFSHALKPGGIYFIEDLLVSRGPAWVDGDQQHVMADVIKDWIEHLMVGEPKWSSGSIPVSHYDSKFASPPGIKSIDCFLSACAIIKCYDDDDRCHYQGINNQLLKYEAVGTAKLNVHKWEEGIAKANRAKANRARGWNFRGKK